MSGPTPPESPPGWVQPREGYTWLRQSTCRGCPAEVGWWMTPAGKQSPHDRDGVSHFATCPDAAQFRRKR